MESFSVPSFDSPPSFPGGMAEIKVASLCLHLERQRSKRMFKSVGLFFSNVSKRKHLYFAKRRVKSLLDLLGTSNSWNQQTWRIPICWLEHLHSRPARVHKDTQHLLNGVWTGLFKFLKRKKKLQGQVCNKRTEKKGILLLTFQSAE